MKRCSRVYRMITALMIAFCLLICNTARAESRENKSLNISIAKAAHLRFHVGGKGVYDRIIKAIIKYLTVRRKMIEDGGYFRAIQVFDDHGNLRDARVWKEIGRSDFMLTRFVLTIEKIMHKTKNRQKEL